MNQKPSAVMFATLMLVAGCASQGPRPATAPSAEGLADFLVDVNGEKFVLRLIAPEQIALARARASGTQPQGIVSGAPVEGDGGFNRDVAANRVWTWHLDPASVSFPQVAMELCDGRPSDVERDKAHWINDVKRFCPWAAKIERELSEGGAWRYDQDFTKPSGWDDEHDGCKVRWCAEKDWNGKAGCAADGALRLISRGDHSIVYVHFGDRDCSRATIKFKYYHVQLVNDPPNVAGSKLQARVAKDGDPSCTTATGGVYRTLKDLNGTSPVKLPKPDCIADEATVEVRPGDTVVYWKFLKGSYPRAMILDDVTIELSGSRNRKPEP